MKRGWGVFEEGAKDNTWVKWRENTAQENGEYLSRDKELHKLELSRALLLLLWTGQNIYVWKT